MLQLAFITKRREAEDELISWNDLDQADSSAATLRAFKFQVLMRKIDVIITLTIIMIMALLELIKK